MLRLEKFDGTKTYIFPNGDIATPAKIREQFPAVDTFPHVLEINGDVVQAVMSLSALRAMNDLDESLTENDAIAEIEAITNRKPEISDLPTPDERIASAMEYQNLLTLPDKEEVDEITEGKNGQLTSTPMAELIKRNVDRGLWSAEMVEVAVKKGAIASAQCEEMTGKDTKSI